MLPKLPKHIGLLILLSLLTACTVLVVGKARTVNMGSETEVAVDSADLDVEWLNRNK